MRTQANFPLGAPQHPLLSLRAQWHASCARHMPPRLPPLARSSSLGPALLQQAPPPVLNWQAVGTTARDATQV